LLFTAYRMGFPGGTNGKRTCLPMQETQQTRVQPLGGEDPLEKGMATHSSVLAWRIPGTEEPGGLPEVYGVAQSRTRLKQLSSSSS